MNEKSGAELAADEIVADYLRQANPKAVTAIAAIITKHLPSGDVGKLREALGDALGYIQRNTVRPVAFDVWKSALASVPANPPQGKVVEYDGAFFCTICGANWGAISRPDKPCIHAKANPPQVDTTLEEKLVDAVKCDYCTPAGYMLHHPYCPHSFENEIRWREGVFNLFALNAWQDLKEKILCGESFKEKLRPHFTTLADTISTHARKSQPKEVPAVTPEIKTGFQTLQKCVFALRLRGDSMADDIWGAICVLSHIFNPAQNPAAESAAVPSMEDSPTWPFVLAFAKRMEAKLAKNRHKGDRAGWLKDHPQALWERIDDEMMELYEALGGDDSELVANEAADVANFALMTADSFDARKEGGK